MNGAWFQAVEQGKVESVVDMLRRGQDVDARNECGSTALMLAVKGGHVELLAVLLDHGASMEPENCIDYSALTYAVILSRTWDDDVWEIPHPDPRPLQILLAAGGQLGLREAVILNDIELARVRLDEGADPDTGADTYDGPVLKIAAHLGHHELVTLLLDRGSDPDATDDLCQTALMCAARAGHVGVVSTLLVRGAKIDRFGCFGQTALEQAVIKGRQDVVDLLLSSGAAL